MDFIRLLEEQGKIDELEQFFQNHYNDMSFEISINHYKDRDSSGILTIIDQFGKYVAKFLMSSFDCKEINLSDNESRNVSNFGVFEARIRKLYLSFMKRSFSNY